MARLKPKYNPTPTAQERRFHLWLMDAYPCVCGCGKPATEVHHPLQRHPAQRWRRDHTFVVPIDWQCHREVHRQGRDTYAERAWQYRSYAIDCEVLGDG
jgi:hypothetical protein